MYISYHFMSNRDREMEMAFFKRAIRNLKNDNIRHGNI